MKLSDNLLLQGRFRDSPLGDVESNLAGRFS